MLTADHYATRPTSANILDATLRDGGGTFTPYGQPVKHQTGYMVSVKGEEEVLDLPTTVDATTLVVSRISRKSFRIKAGRSGHYLGTWIDQGKLYLDRSVWVEDRAAALQMGRNNDQLAIWDCAAGAAISLAAVTA